MIFNLVLIIHAVLCISLVGLVLIQQGKGADMGAAFGGGSNSVFGAGGAADFITKLTTTLAIAFMVTSIILVKVYNNQSVTNFVSTPDPLKGSVLEEEAKAVADLAPQVSATASASVAAEVPTVAATTATK